MQRHSFIPTLVLVTAATAGSLAFAQGSGGKENDAVTDSAKAKVSLAQAIGTAEAQASGKATRAELDGERGAAVYDVEVITADSKVPPTAVDVKVDAASGKVLSSKADTTDRGEDEEDEE